MNYTMFNMDKISSSEIDEIVNVWESSVKATHDFLTEDDIKAIKPFVGSGLLEMDNVVSMKDEENVINAFMGVAKDKIEMLFIKDEYRGKGLGKKLVIYGLENLNVKYVDVNEQNLGAEGFYKHLGFKQFSRSELDGQGNPFPILHMHIDK